MIIISDRNILGGTPVYDGTRTAVQHIAGMLAGGVAPGEVLQDYPYLTHADLNTARKMYPMNTTHTSVHKGSNVVIKPRDGGGHTLTTFNAQVFVDGVELKSLKSIRMNLDATAKIAELHIVVIPESVTVEGANVTVQDEPKKT